MVRRKSFQNEWDLRTKGALHAWFASGLTWAKMSHKEVLDVSCGLGLVQSLVIGILDVVDIDD